MLMAETREIQLNQGSWYPSFFMKITSKLMGEMQFSPKFTPGHSSQAREDSLSLASPKDHVITVPQHDNTTKSISISLHSLLKRWRWWIMVLVNIVSVLAGQTAATLLGRFYFNKGGKSLWMATIVPSAGAPFLIFPLLLISKKSSVARPPLRKIVPIYILLGLMLAGTNLMYSHGLLYLPVSTYSLICATQLGFNVIFSYFINKQKLTALIFNSVVLLTFSATLLGVNSYSSYLNIPKDKYPLGFVLTVCASATFSLMVSLTQLTFEKVIKAQNFSWVLELQISCNTVATLATVVGLFISGEWKDIHVEFQGYKTGKASYALTLAGIAAVWLVSSIGLLGLISMVSSLFANVISTLALPLVPVFAMIFFHDSMNGVKLVSMLIAIWGFLSYIYQHYLDDSKAKKKAEEDNQKKDINGVASLL